MTGNEIVYFYLLMIGLGCVLGIIWTLLFKFVLW